MAWDFVNMNGPYGGVTEGPAWDGSGLLYTHIPSSRILRYDPATHSSAEFRSGTNNANGLVLNSDGRLYACEGGARRVVRYEAALREILAKCKAHNTPTLIHHQTVALTQKWLKEGARFVLYSSDARTMHNGFREEFGAIKSVGEELGGGAAGGVGESAEVI